MGLSQRASSALGIIYRRDGWSSWRSRGWCSLFPEVKKPSLLGEIFDKGKKGQRWKTRNSFSPHTNLSLEDQRQNLIHLRAKMHLFIIFKF